MSNVNLEYLNRNGCVVRKFFLKGNLVDANVCAVKDTLYKVGGKMIFERKFSENSVFCVISLADETKMMTWEALVKLSLKDCTITDASSSKVLVITDTQKNDEAAKEKLKSIKDCLNKYGATSLKEEKLDTGKYQLILFFTNTQKMQEWEKTFGVLNP